MWLETAGYEGEMMMKMKGRSVLVVLAVFAAVLVCVSLGDERATVVASFKVEGPNTDTSPGSDAMRVMWASGETETLIATSRNKMVQAFDPASGKERWKVKFDESIAAITCNGSDVYVALDRGADAEAESIRRLEVATGRDTTPKGIPQPFLPRALVWSSGGWGRGLCVVATEIEGGESSVVVWVYSRDLMSVVKRIRYPGTYPEVSSDGKTILLREHGGRCTVIDPGVGARAHLHGREGDEEEVAIDAPFLSNAFYETGGALVRVIDNSWSTGRIYFHATPSGEAKEDSSENGHAIAAVHWPTKRVAVSGTTMNLLLFSTAGERQVRMKDAVSSRTYSMAFSASGKQLAALGEDGSVRVFEVP